MNMMNVTRHLMFTIERKPLRGDQGLYYLGVKPNEKESHVFFIFNFITDIYIL